MVDVIVEGLNRYLEETRDYKGVKAHGHFVVKREVITPNSFTKAIKEYVNSLYFVQDYYSYLIVRKSYTDRSVTPNEEERCRLEADIQLAQAIFFLFSQEVVMDLIIQGNKEELEEIWHQV
jgi:hypothetical protein